MQDAKLKIIVAEDHAIQRRLLCAVIAELGYQVLPAEDGVEALSLLMHSGAQIVLSDLNMPQLNGIGLTREIRKLASDRYVHVIMLTGVDEESERSAALEAGVDDFISKGAHISMLKARLRAATRLICHEQELADQNRVLREANDRIEGDLRSAAVAQCRLLPDVKTEILGFRIASEFLPSSIVSGDMFGCFPISETRLGFYAVDVSGHGVQASLLSVAIGHLITPEYFRNQTLTPQGSYSPAALVSALNARFFDFESDEYFTMFCGVIDKTTGRMDFCQAGHPSPFYVRPDGRAELVGAGGFPVGLLETASFADDSIQIAPGGRLVMCSDAAIEATDAAMTPFGIPRLQSVIETASKGDADTMPEGIIGALQAWRAGKRFEDDLTVVTLERTSAHDSYNLA